MFLTDNDYKTLIDADILADVINADTETRQKAEKFAQDEISSYLSNKFDCAAIFAATGDTRSQVIIMRMIDITLYNLFASQPDKMGFEIRELRYNNATKWLEMVAKGTVSPTLPLITNEETGETQTLISWGSMTKNNMDY